MQSALLSVLLRSFLALLVVLSAAIGSGLRQASQPTSGPPTSTAPAATAPAASQPAKYSPLFANIKTNRGDIRIELFPNKTPISVANFCNLIRRGFYNDTPWFETSRVVRLAGSPNASPTYRPGYTIKRELHPSLLFDGAGDVAMVKNVDTDSSDSHGSQFFITVKAQDRWNLDFAIFGTVVQGQPVVDALQKGDKLTSITLEGDPTPLLTRYAKQVEKWNAALDRQPLGAPESNATPGSPVLAKPPG